MRKKTTIEGKTLGEDALATIYKRGVGRPWKVGELRRHGADVVGVYDKGGRLRMVVSDSVFNALNKVWS